MGKKIVLSGILGGLILFIWGAASWMLLPYHMATINHFKDEKAIADVIKSNVDKSGIYFMPMMSQEGAAPSVEQMQEPMIFSSVRLQGMSASMYLPMAISLATQILAALLVSYMLMRTIGIGYLGRLGLVLVFALAAGVVTHLPYWTWFGFDSQYTLVQMTDLLIGWFLAGLVLAGICRR